MKNSNWFWAIVAIGLLAWPAVETLRYVQAVNQLAASEQLASDVALQLAQVRAAHTQVAHHDTAPATRPE